MITPETRQYRQFKFDAGEEMRATGRPVVFNSPTVMYEAGGVQYLEQIDSRAFDGADMTDVVLVVDHGGTPAARTRNGTLKLEVRNDALYMEADLSKSSVGADLHSDIRNGVFDRMSFSFSIAQESYDNKTRMRTIERIDRLYDVSAVTFPAYDQTSISARSYFAAEAAREMAEAIEIEKRKQKIKIIALLGGAK